MAKRALWVAGMFFVLAALFFGVARPSYRNWGSTREEQRRSLPGDELFPNAVAQQTRAITIDASIDKVWPWVAQLGQDRGGFYSFDVLENLVGCEMPTVDYLRPDKQTWQIGDKLWMYPPRKAGGMGYATLGTYIPGRALGFSGRAMGTPATEPENGSWSFVLEPVDASHTRVLVRGRDGAGRSWLGLAFDRAIFDPAHFVMERRMLIGIKELVETGSRTRMLNDVHVALWTITFMLFVVSLVRVFTRRQWIQQLAGALTAGIVFPILTLMQPPIVGGIILIYAVVAVMASPPIRRYRGVVRPHSPARAA